MLQIKNPFWTSRLHFLREMGMSLVLALVLCGTAFSQVMVSGRVTSLQGDPLRGVAVAVQGTDIRTTTDADGRFSLSAPGDGVLVATVIGFRAVATNIGGRSTVDILMEPAIAMLDEIVVTGYTEQRRADITGAITTVEMPSVSRQSSASVLQRLDGRVAGVTVNASGSPASRSTVRIRGISSFQNNDPLYIIDGTPVESSYLNFLNPNDVENIQVLKDASAASIYGSRASNGVVIIQTKRGSRGAPQFTLDVKSSVATPVRGYDDFLIYDALEYHEVMKRSYEASGQPVPQNIYGDPENPSVPAYIWPNDGLTATTSVDEDTYAWPGNLIMRGSPGTNWWDEVFSPALVTDANLGVSGGGEDHRYTASFNYLNQEGTAAYNRFQRGSVRINTEFDVGVLTVGENLSVSLENRVGGRGDGAGEEGFMGKNILMQPVVPVYDIGDNWAAGKAVSLGNNSNPLKQAWADKDDVFKNTILFGNVYGVARLAEGLRFRTSFGFNLSDWSQVRYDPISPEESEPSLSDGIEEEFNTFRDWTWTNLLTYATTLGERHNFNVLLGQESNKNTERNLDAEISNLVTTDINARYIDDAIGDPATKHTESAGWRSSLMSFFGKIDYNFDNRYHLNVTLRRDGSSKFEADHRWGMFPAFSVGWRLSEESFLRGNQSFTNVMLRFGWGLTGNQNIPAGRQTSQFGGGTGDTYYDVGGTGSTIVPGYRQTSLGNDSLKWEENESMNLGLDLEFLGGNASLVVDVYQRDTDNLLFDPAQPATAGVADAPIVNIGQMRNRGIDLALGFTGGFGDDGSWSVTLNASHYKNEIVRIDGVQDFFFGDNITARYGFKTINEVGGEIGAFYGLLTDGLFENQAAVDGHASQDGAAVGRLRFVDLDGDGAISADDRTVMGSPHPDLTAGLDLEFTRGAFDFSATLFGSFGNEIMEVNKQFYVFQNFTTTVRKDMLTHAAVVENGQVTNLDVAKYPRLDINDTYSGQQVSDIYVEDGTYVRLRNLQLGYRIPQSFLTQMRVYVQAENLFTITGYPGLDPALPALDEDDPAGDVRDQYRGWDRGAYPSNRMFSLGMNVAF
jgi:TonB-linked SusC/RagA family outer membrane protein